jgi:hypothetical protein
MATTVICVIPTLDSKLLNCRHHVANHHHRHPTGSLKKVLKQFIWPRHKVGMNKKTTVPAPSKLNLLRQICSFIPEFLAAELARETKVDERSRTFSP